MRRQGCIVKNFVCVRDFETRFQAERAKSIVDAANIVAVLLHDDAGGWWGGPLPWPPLPQNHARLLVAPEQAFLADQVLEANGL